MYDFIDIVSSVPNYNFTDNENEIYYETLCYYIKTSIHLCLPTLKTTCLIFSRVKYSPSGTLSLNRSDINIVKHTNTQSVRRKPEKGNNFSCFIHNIF